MSGSVIPVIVFTALWAIVGIVLPFVIPKGPNRGWLCCYMAQMNPLIGPKLTNKTILLIAKEWVRKSDHLNGPCVSVAVYIDIPFHIVVVHFQYCSFLCRFFCKLLLQFLSCHIYIC
ncbi:hypothetical protein C0J52_00403 [Blattella germanica]|nr:hypothetical protein C0J52_00403 [Blattella germanica]